MVRLVFITSGLSDGTGQLSQAAGAVQDDGRLNQKTAKFWKEVLFQAGIVLTPANTFDALDQLPQGFSSFKEPRTVGSNARLDIMIYGHRSGKAFRSDLEFFDHWVHLELYGPNGGCQCCLCTGNKRRTEEKGRLRVSLPTPMPQPRVAAIQQQAAVSAPQPLPTPAPLLAPTPAPSTTLLQGSMPQVYQPAASVPPQSIIENNTITSPHITTSFFDEYASSVPAASTLSGEVWDEYAQQQLYDSIAQFWALQKEWWPPLSDCGQKARRQRDHPAPASAIPSAAVNRLQSLRAQSPALGFTGNFPSLNRNDGTSQGTATGIPSVRTDNTPALNPDNTSNNAPATTSNNSPAGTSATTSSNTGNSASANASAPRTLRTRPITPPDNRGKHPPGGWISKP